MTETTLGYALLHIYDFDFAAALYFPNLERFDSDTPCIITDALGIPQLCHVRGFVNWLNIAVLSDTCDDAASQSQADLIAAFNHDCREGGWLRTMMNYQNPES